MQAVLIIVKSADRAGPRKAAKITLVLVFMQSQNVAEMLLFNFQHFLITHMFYLKGRPQYYKDP